MMKKNLNLDLVLSLLPDTVANIEQKTGFARVTVYRLLAILIEKQLAHKVLAEGSSYAYIYKLGPKPIKTRKIIKPKNMVLDKPITKNIIKHHPLMSMFGM